MEAVFSVESVNATWLSGSFILLKIRNEKNMEVIIERNIIYFFMGLKRFSQPKINLSFFRTKKFHLYIFWYKFRKKSDNYNCTTLTSWKKKEGLKRHEEGFYCMKTFLCAQWQIYKTLHKKRFSLLIFTYHPKTRIK